MIPKQYIPYYEQVLDAHGFTKISVEDFLKLSDIQQFKTKLQPSTIKTVWGLAMRAGKWADTWVIYRENSGLKPFVTLINGAFQSHSGPMFVASFIKNISKGKIQEKLSKSQPASEWIDDFVKSEHPMFDGKSKEERIKMALGAYYAAQQNEEYGAGFEGTNALRDKYIKDTPGQSIQHFKTNMKEKVYSTYQEFAAQHKKMYPSHTPDQIKAAYKKYSEYSEIEEGKFSMRQLYAVVDSTDNTVVGTASSEEAAQRIIRSAHLPPISSKNKDKLKVVKTKKVAEVGYELEEAYGESWVVYNKDTKAKISKSFKNRKAAYDYAAKYGGVVYSAEYYFDNQDDIHSGKLVKEESNEYDVKPRTHLEVTDNKTKKTMTIFVEESLQEAQNFVSKGIYTLDGKKIDGARSSKLFLQALDSDGFLHNLSWKEWSQSDLEDTSSDSAKKQFVDRLAKQIKMFNKRIDLNTWLKGGNRSFTDTVNYIFKLDPNIKYTKASGLKEESLQEAVSKIDVEELLDAAAKMRKEFPQLRKGQSIMLTLHNMNPTMYSMAAAKHDAFTVDAKIPDLINFLDPKYYAESANLDEAMDPQNTSYGYYGTVDVEKYKLIAYKEMADKVLKIARAKKIFANFPNITSNSDQESAVVKYLDSKHGRHIADGNDSPAYIEKDFTKFLKDFTAGHYMESSDLDEAINIRDYNATSEKSQFGGYRPKVVRKDGKTLYLSAASYNTPDEAKDHAEEYLKQYARGISEPRVPVKGTYPTLKEEISLEERRQMKIVALATGSTDLDKIYEYVTSQPLKYSAIVELKENFNNYTQSL
jgi:hypothetical protein